MEIHQQRRDGIISSRSRCKSCDSIDDGLQSVVMISRILPGDHLSGKAGSVGEFETRQGNGRDCVNSWGNVGGKSCHGKMPPNCSLLVEYLCSYCVT